MLEKQWNLKKKQALETAIMLPITLLAPGSGRGSACNTAGLSLAAEKTNGVTISMCRPDLYLHTSLSKE